MSVKNGVLGAIVGLAVTAALTGCGGHADSGHGTKSSLPEVSVEAIAVREEAPVRESVFPARIRSTHEITVTARISGVVTRLPFTEGARFAAGQPLATFEEEESRAALLAAEAGYSASKIELAQSARQHARIESLHAKRIASLRELELAEGEHEAALARYAQAEAEREHWQEGAAPPAPFDGVVVKHHVDPGTRVSMGQPLLEIRSLDEPEIVASVAESELGRLENARAWVRVEGSDWLPAQIDRIEGMTDYRTRTREVFLRLVDGDAQLSPGAYARVRIVTEERGESGAAGRAALFVPVDAVVVRGALTGVFVIDGGRASLRWIRVGAARGGEVEVLSGLRADEVVARQPSRLADGQPVRVNR